MASKELVMSPATNAAWEKLELVVGCPKKLKKKRDSSGIDIHMANIQVVLPDKRRCPLVIDTPMFESGGVYAFDDDAGNPRRCIIIEKGACTWLEQVFRFVANKAFPLLVEKVKSSKDKVPGFCRRLTQPGVSVEDCVRDDFGEECEDGHWYKLAPACKIYNVDENNAELGASNDDDLPKSGYYKLRMRITAFYLGTLGSESTRCCSLLTYVDQIAVKPQPMGAPPAELVLDLAEFATAYVPSIQAGPSTSGKRVTFREEVEEVLPDLFTMTDSQFAEASESILEDELNTPPPPPAEPASTAPKRAKIAGKGQMTPPLPKKQKKANVMQSVLF